MLEITITQFVKELMGKRGKRLKAGLWTIAEELIDEVDGEFNVLRTWTVLGEDLSQVGGLDLRELELVIVMVHRVDLLTVRRAQNLNDFDKLVNARITREQGLAEEQFGDDTA